MATPTAETDLKELRELILGLREEVRVGFAQVETKLAKMDTKLAENKAELKADIQKLDNKLTEVRAELKTDIQKVESKLAETKAELGGKISETRAELGGKIDVLEERTQIGFWGFAARGAIATLLGTVGLTFLRWFWAIGIPKYFPQLLP